jgi:hypothetical protein
MSENSVALGEGRPPAPKRGCLIFCGVIFLLVLLGALYIYHPPLEESTPSLIEIRVWEDEGNKEYRITNPTDCSSVVGAFKRGTLTTPCMCKHIAFFRVRHKDGSVEDVHLLPGHAGPDSCELRMGLLHYRLFRKDLFQIMSSAGIDSSKIPRY